VNKTGRSRRKFAEVLTCEIARPESRAFHLTTGTFNLLSKIELQRRLSGCFSIERAEALSSTLALRRAHRGARFAEANLSNLPRICAGCQRQVVAPLTFLVPGRVLAENHAGRRGKSADLRPERTRASRRPPFGVQQNLKDLS
jgi:hypothetical protein